MHLSSSLVRLLSTIRRRNTRNLCRTISWSIIAVASLALFTIRSVQARQTPRGLVAKGDKSWNEKSYGEAAESYTKALAADPKLPARPEMQLRILIADIKSEKWDDAVSLSDAYQKEYRASIYEGLGLQWRARLYTTIPQNAFRVGKRIYHGSDVPESKGKDTPEQINLGSEDEMEADRCFEQCRLLLDRSRRSSLPAMLRERATEVQAEDDFDLIARANTDDDSSKFGPDRTEWSIDLHQAYDSHWPVARRVMYLYHEIVVIDDETPGSLHHNTVLANLGKAAYILKLRSQGSWVVQRGIAGGQVRVFIPYVKEDPIALLEDTVRKYPDDLEADRLAYTAALWRDQSGDSGHAAAAYHALIAAYPKGRWTSDAKKNLTVLENPSVAVSANAYTRPGTRLTLELTTRNVSLVKFTAYRVHPETQFGHTSYKDEYERYPPFTDIAHHFLSPAEREHYSHEKIAEWTATTSSNGLHNQASDSVNTPLDSLGAYIIEARAADHSNIGADTLAIVSDIAIVQKVDRDSVLCYVADSKTGKPVPGAKLSIWEPRRLDQPERDAIYAAGVTDSGGAFRAALPAQLDAPAGGFSVNRTAETFAWTGGNRYAVSASANYTTAELPIGEAGYRGYITTDRPLYRPAQTINYRLVLTKGSPQGYTLAANKEILLTIEGPKGEVMHANIRTNATGAVNGTFALPAAAELGEYRFVAKPITALKLPDNLVYASHDFRVEEYKKPEYAVTVSPEKSEVRVGEKMSVTISAAYFFGAPVTNARVHYKVYRKPVNHHSPFKPRVDWFPGEPEPRNRFGRFGDDYDTNFWGAPGTVYREGDLISDAKGVAKLTFPTDPPKPPKGYATNPGLDTDQGFTIEATVVDDSRREVSGTGTAVAGALRFHAAMRLDRTFVLPGDALQIEVSTRDSGDRPTAADGAITLWKQIPAIKERKERDDDTGKMVVVQKYVPARQEKDGILLARTDAEHGGSVTAFWHPTTAAEYILEYQAADGWGHNVDVKQPILVYGSNFDDRLEKDDNKWGLGTEHEIYQQGDTARLLLITPQRDSYVLLTDASQGAIRHYRTVFVPGRSTIVEVPLGKEHLPNTVFNASLIVNGQVLETAAEVNVAAVNRALSLSVTTDKKEYKPGEHAVFKLHSVGADSKPVAGEINLGVVDEALLAIQPDETPDIRTSFYGFKIATTVGGASSGDYSPEQKLLGPAESTYETHPLQFPEGMSWFADNGRGSSKELPEYSAFQDADIETDPATVSRQHVYYGLSDAGTNATFHISDGAPTSLDTGFTPGHILAHSQAGDTVVVDNATRTMFYEARDSGGMGGMKAARMAYGRTFVNGSVPIGVELAKMAVGVRLDSPSGALAEAAIRKSFADTAFWMPAVTTDAAGNATVEFNFPDNITKWHITARGITGDVKVGSVESQTLTNKNLLVRLQAPRFFVERDEVTISANVHNYLSSTKQARVELSVDPAVFAAVDDPGAENALIRSVQVEKDGELRVDWTVKVLKPGTSHIKVVAQTDEESDASELTFPVLVHGVEKLVAYSGVLKDGGNTSVTLDIPEMRRKGSSLLDVQMSPSIASVVLDALPFLEDYPYGCVEQTLSRFVPTVTTAKILQGAGIDLEGLGKRAQALEEQRKSIPAQQQFENSGYTYPKGVPGLLDASDLAARMFLHGRSHAPVFDSKQLAAMATAGLNALYDQQRDDGSWGWWKDSAAGDPYLSAYAVEGLLTAKLAGVTIKDEALTKGIAYLDGHLDTTEELNKLAYYGYVLSITGPAGADSPRYKLADNALYTRRDRLSPYGLALLARTLHAYKDNEKALIILRNLVTTAKKDADRGTVHWESADKQYWNWYNDKEETTAAVLQALVAISPQEQLAPVNGTQSAQTGLAPMAVRWLVDNRRGGHWASTRQTANVASALLAYAKAAKELTPDLTVTVDVDGKVQKRYKIDSSNALIFDNRFLVGDEILNSGGQQLHITVSGKGTLYWNSYLKYFDMSDQINAQSNVISVERKYYKIIPNSENARKGKPSRLVSANKSDRTGLSDPNTNTNTSRIPLPDGSSITSGDIIEVELLLKSDNEYAYVVFEDMKPAGCEAVETRSGVAYGDGLCSNFELQDEKVAFFLDTLPQGTRRITYRLRAEVPGVFHALPTNGYAMYAPGIRATSDEWKVGIADAPAVVREGDKRRGRVGDKNKKR